MNESCHYRVRLQSRPAGTVWGETTLFYPVIPALEFVSLSLGGGSLNESLWPASPLAAKVIGRGAFRVCPPVTVLSGNRESDLHTVSTGQRGPTQQVVGNGHE